VKLALVLTASLVACAATVSAQDTPAIGVKAGVNFTTLSFDDDGPETSTRTGVVAGLFASLPVNARLAIQPEFLYASKGARLGNNAEVTLTIDYFEVPVLADVRLNSGPARVSLVLGPSFGVRSRARLTVGDESVDFADVLERVDVGLVAGLAVTSGRIVIDGRYTHGLKGVASDDDDRATNRALSVTLGWRFR
jgi:opacity protein-like surface antigen